MPAPTSNAALAANLAELVMQCCDGDHAAALTAGIGATILLAGCGGDQADAMFEIALTSIAKGRELVAANRAADAARRAVTV